MRKTFFLICGGGLAGFLAGLLAFLLVAPQLSLPRQAPLLHILGVKKPIVFGFLPYWLLNKEDNAHLSSLSMISYYGLAIGTDGHIVKRISPQEPEIGYAKLSSPELQEKLKDAKNKNLILSLVVISQNEASISALLADPQTNAQNLVADVSPIMKQYGFSDLNLDIESFREASDSARVSFTQFLKTVRSEVDRQKLGTMSIDISPSGIVKPYIYQPAEIAQLMDTVVLMAYDYNYRGSYITGPVSPIGGANQVRNFDVVTSLNEALKAIPASKLILGIPLYGYQWETISDQPSQPIVPSSGATATQIRVSDLLKSCSQCQRTFDPVANAPYVVMPGTIDGIFQQIFYEDQESLAKKVELAQKYRLGGIGLWALGYERAEMLKPLQSYKQKVELIR